MHTNMEMRSIKSHKKGMLLAEYNLKVIIAVLVLLLLIYLFFVWYSSLIEKQNFQRAEATLGSLEERMADARKGIEIAPLPLLEPNSWKLISYTSIVGPGACTGNCICLCEDIKWTDRAKVFWVPTQIEKCEIRGICKNFDVSINNFEIILRSSVNVEYKEGGYIISKNATIE